MDFIYNCVHILWILPSISFVYNFFRDIVVQQDIFVTCVLFIWSVCSFSHEHRGLRCTHRQENVYNASYFLFESDPHCRVSNLWPVSQQRKGLNLPSNWSQNNAAQAAESNDVCAFQKCRAGQPVSSTLLVTQWVCISLCDATEMFEMLPHRMEMKYTILEERRGICLANRAVFHKNVRAWPLNERVFSGRCSLCKRCRLFIILSRQARGFDLDLSKENRRGVYAPIGQKRALQAGEKSMGAVCVVIGIDKWKHHVCTIVSFQNSYSTVEQCF